MSNKWNEIYPRPQLVRSEWMGLNGAWRFRTERSSSGTDEPAWNEINIPFCPESKSSRIGRRIAPGEKMIYEREFTVPEEWGDKNVIVNFGAVDQIAKVYVDGKEAGSHEGGYLPFSFNITELLREEAEAVGPVEEDPESADPSDIDNKETVSGEQAHEEASMDLSWEEDEKGSITGTHIIRVEATDDLDHDYPWGKQKRKNGGMWYTPVSGIWKSVWMEPVCDEHIERLRIDCGADWVEIRAYGISGGTISLMGRAHRMAGSGDEEEKCASIHLDIQHPHMWTPEDPYLYDFEIESESGDRVSSYFALRTLTVEERDGYRRLCLNGEPYFFNGLLDQGYWQDGIYTPESPDKIAGDILAMKSLGFNTLRKHIKIEHEQFYYDCDRLGMVVFQDMVNNGRYSFIHDTALPTIGMKNRSDVNAHKGRSRRLFLESMDETVRYLYNHPSVCYWTIFNEGWGQFDSDAAYDRLKGLDDSRFIDSTSGWFWQSKSDVDSYHVYFKPVDLKAGYRPLVLSEFGGYACKLPEHCYNKEKTYGYRKCENEAALLRDMVRLYENEILPLVGRGLCAAIYTQVSDVEDETNGILTYDREILKFRAYDAADADVILGRHTELSGGKVITVPAQSGIKAYVAENHSDHILINSGAGSFTVSFNDRADHGKGTPGALVTGILEGFIDLFGPLQGTGNGLDLYIRNAGAGLSPALEMLICRIISDRYFGGKADAMQLARIASFAEREYLGVQNGIVNQLAIAVGRPALIDFSGREPEIEILDFEGSGVDPGMLANRADREGDRAESTAIQADMLDVAKSLGINRLGDINEVQFRRKSKHLQENVRKGELTQPQIDRAEYFYDEDERVLAASVALRTHNIERFMKCIRESAVSSDALRKM